MVTAPVTASLRDVLDIMLRHGYSRIPVYRESVDDIVGVIYAKDLLRHMHAGKENVPLNMLMREAYFVPETKKVDELLREMQARRVHVAIVVDEYGGTAGLVTIEDILEEIVGEIQDEFDAEEARVQRVSEHEAVVDAMMPLDDVNDLLSMQLQEEDVDTLGGYVYVQLGRVPQQGDEIRVSQPSGGARLVVEEVEGNRVTRVRIIKTPEAPQGRGGSDGAAPHAAALPPDL
jgi:CBS domain containing-hemolysin-like protein